MTEIDTATTDTAAAIAAGLQIGRVFRVDEDGFFALVPDGCSVKHFRDHRDRPGRKTGTVLIHDLTSFKALADLHRDNQTVVYIDRTDGSVTAITDDDGLTEAGWQAHRLVYRCPRSDEWAAWNAAHRKPLSQEAFVDFLEDWRASVHSPDAADLLELIRDLKGQKAVTWRNGIDLRNGAVKLEYVEEVSAESTRPGALEMPAGIAIRVEVFIGQAPIEIPVRLRYAIDKGALTFRVVIDQPRRVEEQALREIAAELAAYWGENGPLVVWATPPAARPYP